MNSTDRTKPAIAARVVRASSRQLAESAKVDDMQLQLQAFDLVATAEERRQRVSTSLDDARAELGQYFTPANVATFLASLFELRSGPARLLDPGAGTGSLSAAFVARWAGLGLGHLDIVAAEVDAALVPELRKTLRDCSTMADVSTQVSDDDFIAGAVKLIKSGAEPTFDYIIMNPPYRKLAASSAERRLLSSIGIEASNLYSAFVALASRLLAPGGQLVAITPRSFANGPYFRAFRQDLLERLTLRRIHVYDSRNQAFADTKVLQENVIFSAERGSKRKTVVISASPSPELPSVSRTVPYAEVVRPDDPDSFIHLTVGNEAADVVSQFRGLPSDLKSLGLTVSTGRVVDFRTRENLLAEHAPGTSAPLIYPTHLQAGELSWPRTGKKPNALALNRSTQPLLLPAGSYVLVKRFSSKEERRRIVASVVHRDDLPGEAWAFENHLNVFHVNNAGLDPLVADGLCVWLNSTAVDVAFRQFSGHTQVNATDLRSMRFPSADELKQLGDLDVDMADQSGVDIAVARTVAGFAE